MQRNMKCILLFFSTYNIREYLNWFDLMRKQEFLVMDLIQGVKEIQDII